MNKQKVKIKSWNRFLTSGLAIKPEILGAKHIFSFNDASVTVKIPDIDQVNRGKGYDEVISVGARQATDNKPIEFDIHKIDVEVSIPIITSVPNEVLRQNANAYALLSDDEQKKLNRIAEKHETIAQDAFEYWLRIVRWVKDDFRIGRRPEVKLLDWRVRLFDEESNHKIWIGGAVFHVPGYRAINFNEWEEIQSKLKSSSQPPIYVELKHDANESFELGDLRKSIVDMAMACETYMRFSVLQKLPEGLSPKLIDYIELANINQYIDKFFPETLDEIGKNKFKGLKSDLVTLFKKRNKLVHMGQVNGIDEELCKRLIITMESLQKI